MYLYECEECGSAFEMLRAISERDAPAARPACPSGSARRRPVVSFSHSRAAFSESEDEGGILEGNTGIFLEECEGTHIDRGLFEGHDTTIRIQGGSARLTGNRGRDNRTNVDAKDADVEFEGNDFG